MINSNLFLLVNFSLYPHSFYFIDVVKYYSIHGRFFCNQKPLVVLLIGKDDKQSSDSAKYLQQGLQQQMEQKCVKRIMAKDVYVMDPMGLEAYNVKTYDELLMQRVYRVVSQCPQNCVLVVENFQYLHVMVLPIFLDILQGVQEEINNILNKPMTIILTTSRGMVDDMLFDQLNENDVVNYQKQTQTWLRIKNYTMWQRDQQALKGYVSDIDAWNNPNYLNRYRNINYIVDYKQMLPPLIRSIDFMIPVAACKARSRMQKALHHQMQQDQVFKDMKYVTLQEHSQVNQQQ
eukprot:TRINITY_DN22832_c0_g3_i6.p1 TRINITY_DN22832_c0_g3~~TRINITY_DN22832_c0_g3_i6.p1  ORF type:complete len:290 (+),score=4.44 TRINITY_DN22832_c0_g3_i6:113-982(+)